MGNTTSSSNPASQHNHSQSPVRRGSPARPPSSTSSHRVHPSLRTKKKSLELPDLASLALTPSSSSPASVSPHGAHRRPRASSPIPIPISAQPTPQTFRPQNNLPSAAHLALNNYNRDPSTFNVPRGRYRSSYLPSANPSTRSFMSRVQDTSPVREELPRPRFVPEVVHSTLPLALIKAEEDATNPEPVSVKIVWHGGGRSVVLARAGDDNWQGRQPMDFDSTTGYWSTYVSLLPGTHHLKFIVDDQWRIADDLPTAADDRDGSLANYVAVTSPMTASPQMATAPAATSVSPLQSPHYVHPAHINSFFSDASSTAGSINDVEDAKEPGRGKEPRWTSDIPLELVAAAAEEEAYLASTDSHDMPSSSSASAFGGIPAPNIPPAPVLPRHLDKLILNVRPANAPGSPGPTERERSRRSGKERSRRERDREGRPRPSALGMTSSTSADFAEGEHPAQQLGLPIVTASGTDVTAGAVPSSPLPEGAAKTNGGVGKLEVAGLADDNSVLPVPSHVVLHHLSTSAIRNGVLAVANTTRYRKKYITTIYYKPT